ncbi:uncharacterized protein AB9X84_011047 [Acanthopagrus schlegelii]
METSRSADKDVNMLRTRAGISQQIDCATAAAAAARSASVSAYLVCNVEYSHLPNSARTELLHEDETSRLRLCWSAYRRGGLLSPARGGEMATSSGGKLNCVDPDWSPQNKDCTCDPGPSVQVHSED